ncbi:hypothetical protein P168DRAFT_299301 [Aspergillus campestris IBT 28561]|uniref:Uncharacterized protein n=1 Tax=Aspergillus campestris (strain IBT 28561) TaxID=1392248 RepID=A0A2I1CVV5_ASPC2|nr:uncharacterized protein P168DRAFT_299301 [Aspergillus campestris IBT 28561]PKY01766.1 hypothetical protein P168DRAFT_299301 [Aspergillus campestris IBT 28561]
MQGTCTFSLSPLTAQFVHAIPDETEDRKLVEGWPSQPRTLGRSTIERIYRGFLDLLGILVSVPFIVLAGIALDRNGKDIEESDWKRIQTSMNVAVTAFPILFAAVIGRFTRVIATWRLERGCSLGILEQLFWSSTFVSAIMTQLFMRSFNLLGLGLIILWVLSPLGGQSSLYILRTARDTTTSVSNIRFFNTSLGASFDSGDIASMPQINALYMSSLLAPQSIKESPMDLWGNVKLPIMSRMDGGTTSHGWKDIKKDSHVVYSSLLGIPFENIQRGSNSSFHMESSYYDIDCFDVSLQPEPVSMTNTTRLDIKIDSKSWSPPVIQKTPDHVFLGNNGSLSCSGQECTTPFTLGLDHYVTDIMHQTLDIFPNVTDNKQTYFDEPPVLLFQSRWWRPSTRQTSVAYCHINQIYVESKVRCVDTQTSIPQCAVHAMRDSLIPHPARDLTNFIFPLTLQGFATYLSESTGTIHPADNSLTERYLNNSANPLLASTGDLPLFLLPKETLSERLTQVVNTYYTSSLLPEGMTGNFSATLANRKSFYDPDYAAVPTTATETAWKPYTYQVNPAWLTIFIVSSTTMLFAAVWTAIIAHRTLIPDVLGYVSTMTRDTGDPSFPGGGTTLDGLDRSRLLKNLPVRLGDSKAGDASTGYLSFTGAGVAQRASRGRYYE